MKAAKLKPEWHSTSSSRVGLLKVTIAILALANLVLLLVLFSANHIRVSQQLGFDSSLPCTPTRAPAQEPDGVPELADSQQQSADDVPELAESQHQESANTRLYPVILNTTNLDTSRGELRTFQPHGVASHLIIEFGAYRTAPNQFSVVALVSQRLHDLHEPPYNCEWAPNTGDSNGRATVIMASNTWPIRPDWELGKMYGTIVVVCTFDEEIGTGGEGGSLTVSVGYADEYRPAEQFVALREAPGEYNASKWTPPFPYEITFCASRLYGDVSPQRVREWISYHALLLGESSHFLFHDAGGLKADVWDVLKPWIDRGRVSVQNLQLLEVYEGRSHHQFSMLNDCMFRAQTLSNWTFFFDVDEYLYVPPGRSLGEILARSERTNVTQIRMKTVKMSDVLCTLDPTVDDSTRDANNARKWAFEKLVYAKCDYGWEPMETRKYALQPRAAIATGVHMCEYMKGGETWDPEEAELRLYHYHGTIPMKTEVCREFTNGTAGSWFTNCTVDRTMPPLAARVKQFELDTLGRQPFMELAA